MFVERAYCLSIRPHTSGQLHSIKIIILKKWQNEKGTLFQGLYSIPFNKEEGACNGQKNH